MNGLTRKRTIDKVAESELQKINRDLLQPKKKRKSEYDLRRMSQQHFQIRQNQLNSKFMLRKRRLERIFKENHNIYIRINSQKSKYNHDQMKRQYQSSRKISKRLEKGRALSRGGSTSRLSHSREGSFPSKRLTLLSYRTPAKPVKCEALDINKLDEKGVFDLKRIFTLKDGIHQAKEAYSSNKQNSHFEKYAFQSLGQQSNNGILSERNKFFIFGRKEMIEGGPLYKTLQTKQQDQCSKHVRSIFTF